LAAAGVAGILIGAGGCHGSSKGSSGSKGQASGSAKVMTAGGFKLVHDDWAKLGYRLDWVGFPFLAEGKNPQVTFAKAYDDLVVLEDKQSTVAALETGNGQTRWSVQLAGPLTKFVGINRDPEQPGMVLVSSESEVFGISTANGNVMDRERFARVINTQPVLTGNLLIAGTSIGEVQAHYLGRNVSAWGFAAVGSFDTNPVVVGGVIGAVSQAGDVVFVSASGSLAGRAHIYEGLDTNPVAENGMLFLAGRDQSVWAFDTTGYTVWRHRTSSKLSTQPTAHNGALYVDIPGEGLTAFEETSGKVLWNAPNVNGTVVAARNGKLLVRKGQTMTMIDPGRGDILERIETPGIVRVVFDQFDDGRMYLVNQQGNVAKMIPR
jgi:hypothetical protein